MSYTNPRGAAQKYNQVRTHAQVEGASPHRLIQMLVEGALEKIRVAKGLIEAHNIPEKVRYINWALTIVDGLRQSLDMENGGQIAQNLDALYDYMQRRLIIANMENNPKILDEVASLLLEIKTAWDAVPEIINKEAKNQAAEQAISAVNP